MKMLKKIIACLLILTFALCAVSCGKKDGEISDAPEGMKSATVGGEPFELFVPMSWLGNTLSGISSATYPYVNGVSVSARYTTYTEAKTLDSYVKDYENEFDALNKLNAYTGAKIPNSLVNIENKAVFHNVTVEKDDMLEFVDKMVNTKIWHE